MLVQASAPQIAALICAGAAMIGLVQTALGTAAAARLLRARRAQAAPQPARPPITILKPLHGAEPLLEEALASFCADDWPDLQILCGVQDDRDPAIAVVQRLIARFPGRIALHVNPAQHGHNRKISNLINLLPHARHEILLISDSDMHAVPGYLDAVAQTLALPGTGLVTSFYAGRAPKAGVIAALAAQHIAQIFIPGAALARMMGRQDCLGATMALRQSTLARAGGLHALLPYVADDAVLGQNVARLGLSVRLAPAVPRTTLAETSAAALWQHELRWARTIRSLEPALFAGSVLQLPTPFALAACLLAGPTPQTLTLLAAFLALRAALGRAAEAAIGADPTPMALAPFRDLLSIAIWGVAHFSNRVAWRGQVLATLAPTHPLTAPHAQAAPVTAHASPLEGHPAP